MDTFAILATSALDTALTIGYLASGQWWKAIYWFGATLIALAVAMMGK